MKKLYLILAVPALIAGAGYAFLATKHPVVAPAPDVRVAMSPERIARGKYLFENLADCDGCHSPRDWDKFSAPVIAETRGSGFEFPASLALPGTIVSANLTPDRETGLGAWTDGEKIRAIREGVSRDGRALFSFMPYQHYRYMSDEDVQSLVAYMNSLPPVRRKAPPTKLDFPVNYLVNDAPHPVDGPVPPPDRSNKVKYGEYLVRLAGCKTCHSKLDKGEPVPGGEFAGGEEFAIGDKLVRSANITPDEESGIGKWTEDRFLAKFQGYAEMTPQNAPKASQADFTLMPWLAFAHLEEEDLRAVYAYLRTLKPVYNQVDKHPQPGTF